jgi:hypothetical protein
MHPWRKTILLSIAGFIALFLSLHLAVNIFGKKMLESRLREALGKKVVIAGLSTYFPAGINIRGVDIEGLCRIEAVSAGGGLIDIFRGRVSLSALKLTRPNFVFTKGSPVSVQPPVGLPEKPVEVRQDSAPEKDKELVLPRIFIGKLVISEGSVNFTDYTVAKDGLEIKAEHLNLRLTNLDLGGPGRRKSEFQLQGAIPWRAGQEKGSIDLKGRIDISKKGMEASLKIEKIDGIYLYPYYSMWVDLQGTRIEKANLNFSSDIKGVNNNVVAVCHLELTDIIRKPLAEGESEQDASKIADAVLDIFRTLDKGKVVLDFVIRTKMDRPELGFGNIRMAFEDKISRAHSGGVNAKDVLIFPAKLLQGAGKGAVDMSKSVMDGIFAMGRQIRRAAVDTFVKPPKVIVPVEK